MKFPAPRTPISVMDATITRDHVIWRSCMAWLSPHILIPKAQYLLPMLKNEYMTAWSVRRSRMTLLAISTHNNHHLNGLC